jgi:hypothetical protein
VLASLGAQRALVSYGGLNDREIEGAKTGILDTLVNVRR